MIRTRQYLTAVLVREEALVLDILRFEQELLDVKDFKLPDKTISQYKITQKEIKMAEQLIDAMSAKWKPDTYHDDYRDALMKLIEKKEKGLTISVKKPKKQPEGKVIDFMALLKKSIAEKNPHKKEIPKKAARGK